MLSVLGWILDGVMLIGQMALWAGETVVNAVLAALTAVYLVAVAILPSMGDAPVLGHPQWLDWLSWFYPVGDLIAGLTGLVSLWMGFLAVRYVLRLVRAI